MALDTQQHAAAHVRSKAIKRKLLLHDGAAFLILTAVTVVLFGVTLFLFRSFSAHRRELAIEWSERGRAALAAGHPEDAIAPLRTALSYAPDERDYQLLLAESLGDAGHVQESMSYFLNLWDSKPGDGFINLQLARLARKSRDRPSLLQKPRDATHDSSQQVVDYYRASIYGSWDGDGVVHRRDVRLELANYLIDQKEYSEARTELLIAASNAPSVYELQVGLGDALVRAGDLPDALVEYEKAMQEDENNSIAFQKAGRLAYEAGDYLHARGWLERALRGGADEPANAFHTQRGGDGDLTALLKNAERVLLLSPENAANPKDRVTRILNERMLARKRYDACAAQLSDRAALPASIQMLGSKWAAEPPATRASLLGNDARQAAVLELVGDTEELTAQLCSAPTGDDALLLRLAQTTKD